MSKRYPFQFLYGAIKSSEANLAGLTGTVFQFLYGAIKSLYTT